MQKLIRSRKAQDVSYDLISNIWSFLMILVVAVGLAGFISYWGSQSTYEKKYLARDIALLAGAVYASPHDVFTDYYYEQYDFTASFKEVTSTGEKLYHVVLSDEDEEKEWYHFAKNNGLLSAAAVELNKGVFLSKKKRNLQVSENKWLNTMALDCPDAIAAQGRVVIDPGHSKNEGYQKGKVSEGELVGQVGRNLKVAFGEKSFLTRSEEGASQRISEPEQVLEEGDIILGIHLGRYDEGNHLKAFYSANTDENTKLRSKRLGCLILNNIADQDMDSYFSGMSVIPIYPEDYENSLLPENHAAILLEIGNINILANLEDGEIADRINLIVEAVKKGVDDFEK